MKLLFLIIMLFSHTVTATLKSQFSIGSGLLSHNYNSESDFFEFTDQQAVYFLPIETRAYFNFKYFYLTPKWIFTPLAKKSHDEAIQTRISILSFPLSFKFNDSFYYSVGLAMYWQMMHGNGGTVIRDDGTGQSSFAKPNYSQTTQQVLLQFEAVYSLTNNYEVGLEIYSAQVFKPKQHFHFLLLFRRHFQLKSLQKWWFE